MGRRRFSGRKETLIRNSRALSPMEKAVFHQIDGAGRSKVKRQFFELNQADVDYIADTLDKRLRARLGIS